MHARAKGKSARWLVPKMVKNGFYPSSAYWRLIWACLVGAPSVLKGGNSWVPTNLKESIFL